MAACVDKDAEQHTTQVEELQIDLDDNETDGEDAHLEESLEDHDSTSSISSMDETECINELTKEVEELKAQKRYSEAATLLSDCETHLLNEMEVSPFGVAALHCLWASLLSLVGEKKQSDQLYGHAAEILENQGLDSSCESDDGSSDTIVNDPRLTEAQSKVEPVKNDPPHETTDEKPLIPSAPRTLSPTRRAFVARRFVHAKSQKMESSLSSSTPSDKEENMRPCERPGSSKDAAPTTGSEQPSVRDAGKELDVAKPVVPLEKGKKRGVAGARCAKPVVPLEKGMNPGRRVGGGFVAVSAPAPREKMKTPVPDDKLDMLVPDIAEDLTPVRENIERDLPDIANSERDLTPPTEDPYLEMYGPLASVVRTCDNYVGNNKLETAVLVLQKLLDVVCVEKSPLRNSDVHVSLFEKYGKIQRMAGDLDSALDAVIAADEILEDRLHGNTDGRRASLHSAMGDLCLEGKDFPLARQFLEKSLHMFSGSQDPFVDINRRKMMASLAHCLTKQGEFELAEKVFHEAHKEM